MHFYFALHNILLWKFPWHGVHTTLPWSAAGVNGVDARLNEFSDLVIGLLLSLSSRETVAEAIQEEHWTFSLSCEYSGMASQSWSNLAWHWYSSLSLFFILPARKCLGAWHAHKYSIEQFYVKERRDNWNESIYPAVVCYLFCLMFKAFYLCKK